MGLDQYLFVALVLCMGRIYKDPDDADLIAITSIIWPAWLLFKAGEAFNNWRE